MNLTNDQRGQLRKDIIDLRAEVTKAAKNPLIPDAVKQAVELQLRIIDTLAIQAGAYEKTEDEVNG